MTKANTTESHEEKGSTLLSNKEEEKPLETISQKEELPEVVPNTPQEGTHLPATGEETSQLALLGLGLLAGLSSLILTKRNKSRSQTQRNFLWNSVPRKFLYLYNSFRV